MPKDASFPTEAGVNQRTVPLADRVEVPCHSSKAMAGVDLTEKFNRDGGFEALELVSPARRDVSILVSPMEVRMAAVTETLFVYGSLRPDGWNYGLIQRYVRSALPASVRGTLVDLGMIPALIPGDGVVKGVLLEVVPAAFTLTDRLEGVPHFYNRAQVIARLADGSEVEAWTYFYSDVERAAQCQRLLIGNKQGRPVYEWVRSHNPS